VRKDQSQRAAALEREREADELRATLIEYNLERVDVALAVVRSAPGRDHEGAEGPGDGAGSWRGRRANVRAEGGVRAGRERGGGGGKAAGAEARRAREASNRSAS
jgi:hypothetical protein